ncbi:MAG: Stp1/IreP family PP2C-type Ser/Thr phosphatase [Nitrospiria bacterium]
MKIMSSGLSDVGRVRTSNEDSMGLFHDLDLYIVADGMGGHAAGEVASKMAVDQIKAYIAASCAGNGTKPGNPQQNEDKLVKAISHANLQIFLTGSKDTALNGMGTTVVALMSRGEELVIGFVGDSRLYLLRDGALQQLTEDHSVVNEYVQKGLIPAEAAEHHPQKHVLSRAMGTAPEVQVEAFTRKPRVGDLYLLCSDGLSNKLNASEIQTILKQSRNIDDASKQLVQHAIHAGGEDNITVLIVSIAE